MTFERGCAIVVACGLSGGAGCSLLIDTGGLTGGESSDAVVSNGPDAQVSAPVDDGSAAEANLTTGEADAGTDASLGGEDAAPAEVSGDADVAESGVGSIDFGRRNAFSCSITFS